MSDVVRRSERVSEQPPSLAIHGASFRSTSFARLFDGQCWPPNSGLHAPFTARPSHDEPRSPLPRPGLAAEPTLSSITAYTYCRRASLACSATRSGLESLAEKNHRMSFPRSASLTRSAATAARGRNLFRISSACLSARRIGDAPARRAARRLAAPPLASPSRLYGSRPSRPSARTSRSRMGRLHFVLARRRLMRARALLLRLGRSLSPTGGEDASFVAAVASG